MKKRLLVAAFLSLVLVFASTAGVSIAQEWATVHVTGPIMLKGSIANVQLDSDGNPEWIESGFWVLRLRPGATDSELPSAQLVAGSRWSE